MQKFWMPERVPDGLLLLNEDVWFQRYQKLLLAVANTDFGRDIFRIPKAYPKIVKMTKCAVHCLVQDDGVTSTVIADFRIGAKYANAVRQHWDTFNSYARYFQSDHPVSASPLTKYAMSVSALTLTVFPNPSPETTSFDGYAGEEDTAWATAHNSGSATGTVDHTGTILVFEGNKLGSNDFVIGRIWTLFDTSSLTALAVISAAVHSMDYKVQGTNTELASVRIVTSAPASNTTLAAADYPNMGTAAQANDVVTNTQTINAYTDFTYNGTGIANVSLTGVTKMGVRNTNDADNSAPSSNNANPYCQYYAADSAGTSTDPKLVVTYTIASASLGVPAPQIIGFY